MDDENLTLPVPVSNFPVSSFQPGNYPGDIIQWNGTTWTITPNAVTNPLVIENYTGVTPNIPTSLSQGYIYKKPLDDNLYWVTNGSGELALLTSVPGGSITGPATSTNNALVLWNGTTGTSIKDSTVTLSAGIFSNLASSTAVSYDTTLNQNNQPILSQQTSNLLVGLLALDSLTIGTGNLAIGPSALTLCSSGEQNTAVGYQTLSQLTTQARNTAVGYSAAQQVTAADNTAVGSSALSALQAGSCNTAVGSGALYSAVSSTGSSALGYYTLHNSTGSYNTAVGYQAGLLSQTATCNTLLGYNVLMADSGSSYNTIVGCSAMATTATGQHNSIVGYNALTSYNGDNNVAIGSSIVTGMGGIGTSSNNVLLGCNVSAGTDATTTNRIVLGYNAVGLADNSLTLANSIVTLYMEGLSNTAADQLLYYNSATGAVTRGLLTAPLISGGPLQLSNGTVGAPTYSFSSDTNTGMYSSVADTIDFATGGVLRFTINATTITSTLPITATLFSGSGASLTNIPQSAVTSLVTDLAAINTSLSNKQPLDADLTAIAALATTGLAARTASNTWTTRTVIGTAGTITVTNGDGVSGNPTLTIDSSYVGQATITTLGTITTGTWSASTIAATRGGTGQTLYAVGDILYASTTTALSKLAVGTNGQFLKLATGLPSWATIAQSDVTNLTTDLANKQPLDADLTAIAALATTGLAARTASNTWTTRTVTGTAGTITVTNGDGVSGNPTLTIASSYVGQATITTLGTITTGTWSATAIAATRGGTAQTTYAAGDMIYASALDTLSKLTIGANGSALTSNGTIPTWSAALTLALGSVTTPAYSFLADTNTGMYSSTADTIDFATGGVQRLTISTTAITPTLPILGPAGLITAPAYSFSADPNTGIYNVAADTLGLVTGGSSRITIGTGSITANLPIAAQLGSVTAPAYSFSGDLNTGVYSSAADTLNLTTGGVLRLTLSTTALTNTLAILNQDGSAATPAYSFANNTDMGIYRSALNTVGIATGGTERITIDTGNITTILKILGQSGSALLPSYSFSIDTDTGIFSAGVNTLGLSAGGTSRVQLSTTALTSTLPILNQDGAASTPAYSFASDTNTGLYLSAADTLEFSTGGTSRLTLSTSALTSAVEIDTPTLTLNGSQTICCSMPNYILCVGQTLTTSAVVQTFELDYAGTSIFNGWELPVDFRYTHVTVSADSDASSASRTYNFEIYDSDAATVRSSGSLTTANMGGSNTHSATLTVSSSVPAGNKTQLRVYVSATQSPAAEFIVYMHGYPG